MATRSLLFCTFSSLIFGRSFAQNATDNLQYVDQLIGSANGGKLHDTCSCIETLTLQVMSLLVRLCHMAWQKPLPMSILEAIKVALRLKAEA
jgi:hypothetical protein